MALLKSRPRIYVRGLGNLYLREKEPSVGTEFSDVGYLEGTNPEDARETEDLIAETGQLVDIVEKSDNFSLSSVLMQTGIDEIDLARTGAAKVYAARYFGPMNPCGRIYDEICPGKAWNSDCDQGSQGSVAFLRRAELRRAPGRCGNLDSEPPSLDNAAATPEYGHSEDSRHLWV
jgi:hypothetical protein